MECVGLLINVNPRKSILKTYVDDGPNKLCHFLTAVFLVHYVQCNQYRLKHTFKKKQLRLQVRGHCHVQGDADHPGQQGGGQEYV
jgi:hypothetical protein